MFLREARGKPRGVASNVRPGRVQGKVEMVFQILLTSDRVDWPKSKVLISPECVFPTSFKSETQEVRSVPVSFGTTVVFLSVVCVVQSRHDKPGS